MYELQNEKLGCLANIQLTIQTLSSQNITGSSHVTALQYTTVCFLPLLVIALAGISIYFLYKHWYNLEPIHTLWALFYGTQALKILTSEINLLLEHFTSSSACPQNIALFFTCILFFSSVILVQVDRWAALYFSSKYKSLVTNKTAVAVCSAVFALALALSIAVLIMDSSYIECAHPPSLRFTRRTTIYLEGMIRMTAILLTSVVSFYAVKIKMKNNKVTPVNVQLGNLKRNEEVIEMRVKRAANTRDIFYMEQHSNVIQEAPEASAAMIDEEQKNFLQLVKEIIEGNKMPLMITVGTVCNPILGLMYAGCEEDNTCEGFLVKFKFYGAFQLIMLIVEVVVTVANINKF